MATRSGGQKHGDEAAPETIGGKPFGWHGLTCVLPADWDLTGASGTAREGYFSFDDDRMRRLEIKFARAKRWGQPALEKTLEFYFQTVQKKLKRATPFAVDYDVKLAGAERLPPEYEYRVYGWTSDLVARGIIWKCAVCRRVVIAQVLAAPNRVNLREMSDVLTSIRCHETGPERTWAVFDFAVSVPAEFELETSKLQAGLISLAFATKRERLVVERIGMAQAVLKHSPMDRWVADVHWKKLRRRRIRFDREDWQGHPGCRIEGERIRLMYYLPGLGPTLRAWRKKDHIAGRLWHCPDANRLFIVRAEGRGAADIADRVATGIPCHGTA